MRRGAAQEKIDADIPTEGSNQKVRIVPEPREPTPEERPGAQWSIPRRRDLPQNAQRRVPGAIEPLKAQGPVIVTPTGAGYGGKRTWEPNAPPEPPEAGPTVGNGTPYKRGGTNLVGKPKQPTQTPEWMEHQEASNTSHYQQVLDDPASTAVEKEAARRALNMDYPGR
jgi:hypothetical protein